MAGIASQYKSDAPIGGEGSIRWHEVDNELEVYDGTAWQRVSFNSELPWETIAAGDNASWGNAVLRLSRL